MRARKHKSVTRWRRDVTDGALGSYSEAQGARATSSGGYFALGIHRTDPAPGPGGPRSVSGATPGRQGRRGNPDRVGHDQCGKGVKRHQAACITIIMDLACFSIAEYFPPVSEHALTLVSAASIQESKCRMNHQCQGTVSAASIQESGHLMT